MLQESSKNYLKLPPKYNAICVDPGFGHAGISVFSCEHNKVLEPIYADVLVTEVQDEALYKSSSNFIRAMQLYDELDFIFTECNPTVLCMESISHTRNAVSNAQVSAFLGVLSTFAFDNNMLVLEASPQHLKKLVCGKHNASKEEIKEAIEKRFGEKLSDLLKENKAKQKVHAFDSASSVYLIEDPTCQIYRLDKLTGGVHARPREKAR
jgi:Holliday junction resolvasome RuvABC endonuclease subunit